MTLITGIELDALKEVGNVGVGNAATALAKLLDKRVSIDLPDTRFVPLQLFANELGSPEDIVHGMYLQLTGELEGECIFIFSEEDAKKFIDLALGEPVGTTQVIGELEHLSILMDTETAKSEKYQILLTDRDATYLFQACTVMDIKKKTENIAGVEIPVFEEVEYF